MVPFTLADGSEFLLADGARFLVAGDAPSFWLAAAVAVIGIGCVVVLNRWATGSLTP